MSDLRRRLSQKKWLIDGAMGTMLQTKGWQIGSCPELWCIDHPNIVKAIHQNYCDSGAEFIETNSFGGNRCRLANFALATRVIEINTAAVRLAQQVADDQYILASAGPTGKKIADNLDAADIYAAYLEQMRTFVQAGADAVIIETMYDLQEAELAVKAAKTAGDLVVFVSFTFAPAPDKTGFATLTGVTPSQMAKAMQQSGVDAIGSNCLGAKPMLDITKELKQTTPDLPILAMPNAGLPVIENGQAVYEETPEIFAQSVAQLILAGATILGGCCGTTPTHIAAIKKILT